MRKPWVLATADASRTCANASFIQGAKCDQGIGSGCDPQHGWLVSALIQDSIDPTQPGRSSRNIPERRARLTVDHPLIFSGEACRTRTGGRGHTTIDAIVTSYALSSAVTPVTALTRHAGSHEAGQLPGKLLSPRAPPSAPCRCLPPPNTTSSRQLWRPDPCTYPVLNSPFLSMCIPPVATHL